MQHPSFQLPKGGFSLFGKQLADCFPKPSFDVAIEIDKGEAGVPLQCFTDRCLSGSHVAYQIDSFHIRFCINDANLLKF